MNNIRSIEENPLEEFKNCTKCAECCLSLTEEGIFTIPITKIDAKRIKKNEIFKKFKKENKIKISKGTYDIYYPYDLVAKGICPFLTSDTKRCMIYPDRPSNCASFKCYE